LQYAAELVLVSPVFDFRATLRQLRQSPAHIAACLLSLTVGIAICVAQSIADIVGISPGNVATKVHRTKQMLSRRFHAGCLRSRRGVSEGRA
jgi:hypothetical protein